jgi:hypothetical protein
MHFCKGLLISFFFVSGFLVGVSGFTSDEISTFVSPDSSYEGFETFINTVDSFLYLSVYQISSSGVAEEIFELLKRGKNVTIIVDDSPAEYFEEVFLYDWGIVQGDSGGADNWIIIVIAAAAVIAMFIVRRAR